MLGGIGIAVAGKIIGKVIDIIDKNIQDKDLKEQLRTQITQILLQKDIQEITAQERIIVSELHGNTLQRSWRPLLMYLIIIILFNNYVIFPYLSMFTDKVRVLEMPEFFWYFLIVGVGGYIPARTYEKSKIFSKINELVANINITKDQNKKDNNKNSK